jgi:hypothetical protein
MAGLVIFACLPKLALLVLRKTNARGVAEFKMSDKASFMVEVYSSISSCFIFCRFRVTSSSSIGGVRSLTISNSLTTETLMSSVDSLNKARRLVLRV